MLLPKWISSGIPTMWLNLLCWDSCRIHICRNLFLVFLFIFLFTVLASLLIVITISLSPALSAQIYFFLTYLALTDAFYTSVITLKMIIYLLYQRRITSWSDSLKQIFLVHFLGGSDIIVLTVVACDHYVGIEASALHDHQAKGALPTRGGGGLDWRNPTCHCVNSLHGWLDFLWFQCRWSFHVWFLLTLGNCFQWHLQDWNGGGN